MRTLKNNTGFYFDFPSVINEVLSNDFSKTFDKNFIPATNIAKLDEQYIIELVIPGFSKEEIKLNVENGKLIVSSEFEEEKEEATKKFNVKEFTKKTFSRTFTLPKNEINEDQISAKYTNGILTISLPKLEKAKEKEPKLITIS